MQFQILRIVDGGKQEVRQRIFLLGWGVAHRRSEITLRVIVDEKYAFVFACQSRSKVQSGGRLADAAFWLVIAKIVFIVSSCKKYSSQLPKLAVQISVCNSFANRIIKLQKNKKKREIVQFRAYLRIIRIFAVASTKK